MAKQPRKWVEQRVVRQVEGAQVLQVANGGGNHGDGIKLQVKLLKTGHLEDDRRDAPCHLVVWNKKSKQN